MTAPARTRPCKQCGKEVPVGRGVCPHCGGMSAWFRVRLFIGCAFVLIGLLAFAAIAIQSLLGISPPQPPAAPASMPAAPTPTEPTPGQE